MTHYKITWNRGQCRGRPPTRAPNKDWPEDCRLSIVDCRLSRELDILNFGYVESAITLPSVPLSALSALVVNRRPHTKLSLARDWLSHTCSVNSTTIAQDRKKDRLIQQQTLLKNGGKEELCLLTKNE